MAHRICGIDIGDHSIKAVLFETKLRSSQVVAYEELPVGGRITGPEEAPPPPPAPENDVAADEQLPAAQQEADAPEPSQEGEGESTRQTRPTSSLLSLQQQAQLRRVLRDPRFRADTMIMAVPGSVTLTRYLSFPFTDPRKISPVVGYELEGQIPYDIDEVVFDHLILESKRPGGQPQARVLVAAASYDLIESFLADLKKTGADPDLLTVAPVTYGYLAPAREEEPESDELTAVIDMGHRHTNLCLVERGKPIFVRTLSRGGAHLTEAIARDLNVSAREAEAIKHQRGFVPDGGELDHSDGVGQAISKALHLWDLGVRQSLAAIRSDLDRSPSKVVLCGGASRLEGLERHVAGLFGLAENVVSRAERVSPEGLGPEAALAAGLCHVATARKREILDLRRGSLAPSSKKSLFREKALAFAVFAVVALGLLVANGWAKLHRLEKEEVLLTGALAEQTERVLGRSMTNPILVLKRIRRLRRRKGATGLPIPNSSAYAIVSEISRKTPSKDEITLDVRKLDIRERKITLKGTAGSATEVEEFVKALGDIKCFEKVQPGTTTEIGTGEETRSEFTINIVSNCM
jgi:type IV pilus assembly protein PilM